MTVIVHHLNNSRSQRILWLLEELGVPYEIKLYLRDKKTSLAPKELEEVHPLGKSPVITDGENTVAETGAITEYLVGKYGNGKLIPPADSKERLRYTYYLHYAEGSLMPLLVMSLIFTKLTTSTPFFLRPIASLIAGAVRSNYLQPNLDKNIRFLNSELQQNQWFAGRDFTAADIMMSFPVEALGSGRAGDLHEKGPQLLKFLEAIHARPAYKAALEKGGKENFALKF